MNVENRKLVSIIVPIYNVEKYLKRCLDSLLKQSLRDIEIILVDDGSNDHSPAIVDEYARMDDRIKVIHKNNAGLGLARNSGLEIAQGEYIGFIDSDDYIALDMYEKLYHTAKKSNSDIVYSGFYKEVGNTFQIVNEFDKEVSFSKDDVKEITKSFITKETRIGRRIQRMVWRGIYKRSIIKQNDIKFPNERIIPSEDLIFQTAITPKANKITFIPTPLVYYCFYGNSLSTRFNYNRYEMLINEWRELKQNFSDIKIDIFFIDNIFFLSTKGYIYNLCSSKSISFSDKINRIKCITNDPYWDNIKFEYLSCAEKLFYGIFIKKQAYYLYAFCKFSVRIQRLIGRNRI